MVSRTCAVGDIASGDVHGVRQGGTGHRWHETLADDPPREPQGLNDRRQCRTGGYPSPATVRGGRDPLRLADCAIRLATGLLILLLAHGGCATAQAEEVPVPYSWSLKPTNLTAAGSRFRLIFMTSNGLQPFQNGIETFDQHVQSALSRGHSDIREYRSTFRAVVSSSTEDARDHIDARGTGVRIYWLNGHQAARNHADFFDSGLAGTPKNESGGNASGAYWTGSNDDGTKYENQWVGPPTSSSIRWGDVNHGLDGGPSNVLTSLAVLGMSPVFRVLERNMPSISSIRITSTPVGSSYRSGETIKIAVTFDRETTTVTTGGTPSIGLTIGANTRSASYSASDSSATELVFRYVVADEDRDPNGISIAQSALALNGGAIRDRESRTNAELFHFGLSNQAAHKVNVARLSITGLALLAAA